MPRARSSARWSSSGLSSPLDIASTRTEPRRLYVVEQRGTIRVLDRGKLRKGFFLDVRKLVVSGGEQGLLGLAFDPKYASNRFVYVDYTDTNGDTRVVRYKTNGTRALPSTARILLRIDQPYANHNGGDLVFGPDGGLYVGTGDGGSGGDPENRAQNMQTLLGKMLRLDVRKPGSAPTIVALGLRNPWRYSFDRATGDLYIGDVGQGDVEEIDVTPKSQTGLLNYGWDVYEGSRHFEDKAPGPGTLVFPVYQYTHDNGGCTVVGGYVYRGKAQPRRARPVHPRRLLQRCDHEPAHRGRQGDGRARRAVHDPEPLLVRRGRSGRALRDVARRHPLPPELSCFAGQRCSRSLLAAAIPKVSASRPLSQLLLLRYQLARRRTRGGAWPSAA